MATDYSRSIENYVGHIDGSMPIMPEPFTEASRARVNPQVRRRDVLRGFNLVGQKKPLRIGDILKAEFPKPGHKPDAFNNTTSDTEVNFIIVGVVPQRTPEGLVDNLVVQETGTRDYHFISQSQLETHTILGFRVRDVVKPDSKNKTRTPRSEARRADPEWFEQYKRFKLEQNSEASLDPNVAREDPTLWLKDTDELTVVDPNNESSTLKVCAIDQQSGVIYFDDSGNRFGVAMDLVRKNGIVLEPGRGRLRIRGIEPDSVPEDEKVSEKTSHARVETAIREPRRHHGFNKY